MFKQIKTISALALSFFILVNANAQDFIKPLKVRSEISDKRLKELQAAADSLTEADVYTEEGTKNTYKYFFTKALEAWKKANPQAITSVLADKPITGIHELAVKEAVDLGKSQVAEPDKQKLMAEAEKKYPAYIVGTVVKNMEYAVTPVRKSKASGKIRFINNTHVKIGFKDYKISDFLDPLFKQGLNPVKTRFARANHVNRAISVADSERNEIIKETYPKAFTARVQKNENSGFIYIAKADQWFTPDVLIKPMIEAQVSKIDKMIEEREQAEELRKLEELKRVNKVKKVLLGVNEEFVIQFERLVIKDLVKVEQNKVIEAEKKAKLEAEQAAAIAAEEEAQRKAEEAAKALKAKQAKAKAEKDARDAKLKAEKDAADQNKMYAMIAAGGVAAVFLFLLVNPKTREKFFTKKKKSLDQVVANLQTDDEAESAAPMEQTQSGLTLDEQLDGDSKGSINLGVVPGHAPEQDAAAPQAPSLEPPSLEPPSLEPPSLEPPSLEPPSLQAPGKSTGKPSLIINPDLQIKTDEGSKLKLKK